MLRLNTQKESLYFIYNMINAKNEIIQTMRANNFHYYFSILTKQNLSGILYNERLFFLLSTQHIGYISSANANETASSVDFSKAKQAVHLGDITNISFNKDQLHVQYNSNQYNQRLQKKWMLRFNTERLCTQWYNLLYREIYNFRNNQYRQPVVENKVIETGFNPKKKTSVKYQDKLTKIINKNPSQKSDFRNASPQALKTEIKKQVQLYKTTQMHKPQMHKTADRLNNRIYFQEKYLKQAKSQIPYHRIQQQQREYYNRSISSKKNNQLSPLSNNRLSPYRAYSRQSNNTPNKRQKNISKISEKQQRINLSNQLYHQKVHDKQTYLLKNHYNKIEKQQSIEKGNEINNYYQQLLILNQMQKFEMEKQNLQKTLKNYLYTTLSRLHPQIASRYIDIIYLLPVEITEARYFNSFSLLKARLQDRSFYSNMQTYLEKLVRLKIPTEETQILKDWQYSDEVYPRQSVEDFFSLTTELLGFLGADFMLNTLKQALR